jgi:hypothetical protein
VARQQRRQGRFLGRRKRIAGCCLSWQLSLIILPSC